jgi:hypothetical protein
VRHELSSEIDIEARPDVVWSHLSDLAGYAAWNPFITAAAGEAVPGRRLELRMEPPGGRAVTLRPRVTSASAGSTLEWLGHLGVPGIFDGRHHFELRPTATGTRLVQRETFTGVLVRPFRRSLDTRTLAGFEAMDAALRRRVLDVPGCGPGAPARS